MTGQEAAEKIKREQAERERLHIEAMTRAEMLTMGTRLFWEQLQETLSRELEAFKTGIAPQADHVQGQAVNPKNFTVFSSGKHMLVVSLDHNDVVDCQFTNPRPFSNQHTRTQSSFSYDETTGTVKLDGQTVDEAANTILAPVYEYFSNA